MNFEASRLEFRTLGRAMIVGVALVLLPMGSFEWRSAIGDEAAQGGATQAAPGFKSSPAAGATDVDPNLKEIVLTFDRDMGQGMSWTGDPKLFPPVDPARKAQWRDARTCVLPVKLKEAAFYIVGVNSKSHQNFRSAQGVPALPATVAFTTRGANEALKHRLQAPKVVQAEPENGASEVDPATKLLRITFDLPMGDGFSWTGENVPSVKGQAAHWSSDGRTCTLAVALQPGTEYTIGLNSRQHTNFKSRWGVPLQPVVYRFKTSGEKPREAAKGRTPRIVELSPKNGAKDVDPSLQEIRVTFDRPMSKGMSWTGGGEHFPQLASGKRPSWSADKKTCTLPVELKADWRYELGLNSRSYKNFVSEEGEPLEPVVYRFKTAAAKK